MKRLFAVLTLVLVAALPAVAQPPARVTGDQNFASDFQTIPVVSNVAGANGSRFQTAIALLNPTATAFPVSVAFYDAAGVRRDATIQLAAGELKTYDNFLESVFAVQGGGAVTFSAPPSAGGQRNNRFVISSEVRTAGNRFSTSIPVLEFAGSASRSFAAGVSVGSTTRTNVGCFNQSDEAQTIRATLFDNSGRQNLGSVSLTLPAKGWGQTNVPMVVSNGYIQFDPAAEAVCYAVVVDNTTNDGNFITAVEYAP